MKRLSLFCGHYGSGKTNIAVNYAVRLKEEGKKVTIADLDIVNPYFRTRDSEEMLERAGVRLLTLPYANTNIDMPTIPSEAYSLFRPETGHCVLDIGGDDRGAYVLGQFAPFILEENDYDMFFVVNYCRPLTPTPEKALEVLREIEEACGIGFTALINNSNLGAWTDRRLIEESRGKALELSRLTGLPLAMTTVRRDLAAEGEFPLDLQKGC
ncbi:MAG: hypothetical protein II700_01500 [Firmicutes bacterium]|nr:hypothetical protein [Bacillota bacterium]